MKIIAIDSSGLVASVAIVQDEEVIAEYNVQYKKTHSQTLLPMLDELKRMVDLVQLQRKQPVPNCQLQ